jgi:hypothetical protein
VLRSPLGLVRGELIHYVQYILLHLLCTHATLFQRAVVPLVEDILDELILVLNSEQHKPV